MASDYIFGAFSPDNELFCTIGDNGSHINFYETYNLTFMLKIFCAGTFVKKMEFHQNSEALFVITTDCKIRIYALQNFLENFQMNAYFIKEINCLHRDSLNDMALSPNNRFLFTVGSDNLLKIWEMSNLFSLTSSQPQIFIGHTNPISSVVLKASSGKLFTAGGFEGVYVWDLLDDMENDPVSVDVDFNKYVPISKRRPEVKLPSQLAKSLGASQLEELKEDFCGESEVIAKNLINDNVREESSPGVSPKERGLNASRHDSNLKKMSEFKKGLFENSQFGVFNVEKVSDDFKPFIREFKKLRPKKYKYPIYFYEKDEIRKKFNLPFKHYFMERREEDEFNLKEKLEKIKSNTQNLELQYLIGYNNNGHQNLIWNYMSGWFAYSIENMVHLNPYLIKSLNLLDNH